MATPIGADHITAIVNRYMMDDIIDLAYDGNPLFYRIHNSNRRMVDGGPHIEQPVMVSKFTSGGSFSDLETLEMTPQDTLRTVAWDWKEKYVPVAFSNLTMVKLNTADSIANGVEVQVQQAAMTMADLLGDGLYDESSDNKEIDSLPDAIDDSNAYAGISRSGATGWWNSTPATALDLTAADALPQLNEAQTSAVVGGRFPTIAVCNVGVYNAIWNLLVERQSFQTRNESDTQMAAAGFNNFMFNGTPFIIDPKCGATDLYFLNEDFIKLVVTPLSDFRMEPFQQAFNQAAIGAKLLWTGNLIVTAPKLQYRATGVVV
jgi:hypothetical protein